MTTSNNEQENNQLGTCTCIRTGVCYMSIIELNMESCRVSDKPAPSNDRQPSIEGLSTATVIKTGQYNVN